MRDRILNVWEAPDFTLDGCTSPDVTSFFDAPDIERWVAGVPLSKENILALAKSDPIEVEMPLFCVKEEFLDCFLGIYMVNIAGTLDLWADSPFFDFSVIHFAAFLATDRFPSAFLRLSETKKYLVLQFLRIFIPTVSQNPNFCALLSQEKMLRLSTVLREVQK